MEMKTDGIKRNGAELPFNLQVENLSVQIGDSHSTTYYHDGGCGNCDRPEPLPSWEEYSDFFSADDDGFQIDMDKMAEKIHKDTKVPLDTVKTILYAESEIMDDLGIMDMVLDGDSCEECGCSGCGECAGSSGDKPADKEEHGLFEGMTHEEACEATERLLKAIFPELKDKKFTFAVGKVVGAENEEEGTDGKK